MKMQTIKMSADAPSVAPSVAAHKSWPSAVMGWYTVAVLFVAYTFSYVDRIILTIVMEPVQRQFSLNDSQVALLHGLAFTIFYVGLGIPLGWAADRWSRRKLIVASVIVWSITTASCGFAKSFSQLFIARIGVGVGEAGLSPASYSLIGDYFPPSRRSGALGTYSVAMFFGGGLALLIGGLVVQLVGHNPTVDFPLVGTIRSWQAVFICVGLPGFLVALLALTLRDPVRRSELAGHEDGAETPAQEVTTRSFGRQWSMHGGAYLLHFLGFAMLSIPFNVTLLWARPYLTRHFGITPPQGAYMVGGLMLVFASLGLIVGSTLADRFQRNGKVDGTIRVALIAALGLVVPLALFPLMPTLLLAGLALALILFFGAFAYGAAPAALQVFTPNHMRATMSALYLLGINVIGLTVGPTLTGALTDYVFHDKTRVGESSAIVAVIGALVAAVLFACLLPRLRRAVALEHRLSA